MNPKLKSTLVKSWHEPRLFFLWLTLASGLIVASVALYAATVSPPHRDVQLLALLFALTLICSLAAFIIAWIPPVRRLLHWVLQRKLLALASLATLIALFYAVENFRGKQAWANYRKTWEAKGERFDLAGIVPPPVPDDENFFMTKPWEFLRFTATSQSGGWTETELTELNDQQILKTSVGDYSREPSFGSRDTGTRTDLAAWQNYYRGTNNQFAAPDGTITNYFPVAPAPQTPARDVLLALTKDAGTLAELRAATRRPRARFWINYEANVAMLFPHLPKLKGIVRYLTLHAIAALADEQAEVACADLVLALQITATIDREPILISQLVNIACTQISLTAIWEGLLDQRWNDAQLAEIEAALARRNFLANYQLAIRGERNLFCLAFLDEIRKTREWNLYFGDPEQPAPASLFEDTFGSSAFRLVPSGWFDQNKCSLTRMAQELFLPAVNLEQRTVSPTRIRQLDTQIGSELRRFSPFNLFAPMLLPPLQKASQKQALAQAHVDLARVAIALERHRLAHGQYPESLDALVPKFIAKLPPDVINGQPLHYRRASDDSFLLHSVGWNETDDGGQVVRVKNSPRSDIEKGDWGWSSTAKQTAKSE